MTLDERAGLRYRAPDLIRCPRCRRVLGERVEGLALVKHRGRRALAVWVGCDACPDGWTSDQHRALVDRARGLSRLTDETARVD